MKLSRKKKIIIGASAVLLLLLIIVVAFLATHSDNPEVTVVKIEVKPELRSTVVSSGEVRPIQFMNLTSEVQGRIEEITKKEGDPVTKGEVLVRLDPDQLQSSTEAQLAAFQSAQNEIQVSQSQVAAAQSNLQQAQVAVENARQNVITAQTEVDRSQVEVNAATRELKRNEQMLESGVIARQEFDASKDRVENARVSLNNAKARLESQRISIKEAQTRVANAQRAVQTASLSVDSSRSRADQQSAVLRGSRTQRDKSVVIAPINGVIAEIPSKVGTFAVAGLSTTPLLTIADMSSINVEVKVDETAIDKVEVGQKAKIKVDAFGDQELEGEVIQKTPLAVGKSQTGGGLSTNINVQEAKEFRVVLHLVNLTNEMQSALRPGMSATATITTKTVQSVIAVPLQAVVEKKPDSSSGSSGSSETPATSATSETSATSPKPIKGVFVMENGKAKFYEVTTGITGESDIQITSGLSPDQEVITGPSRVLNTLKEGTVVKKSTKKEGDNSNRS